MLKEESKTCKEGETTVVGDTGSGGVMGTCENRSL